MSYLDDFYHQIYYYRKFTYHTSFGLIIGTEFILRALTFFVACYIFRKINEHAINETFKKEEEPKKVEQHPQTPELTITPSSSYYLLQQVFSVIKKLVAIIHWVVSFLGTFYLSLAAAVLQGFHVISWPTCLILTVVIYLMYFLSFILRDVPLWKMKSEEGYEIYKLPSLKRWSVVVRVAFLKHRTFYVVLAIVCFILAMLIPLMLDELCVCFFCNYGICLSSEFDRISSSMMRRFTIPDSCPPGPPCHVYTTLPEDGSKSVFLNVHTSIDTDEIRILYDTLDNFNEYGRVQNRASSLSSKFDIEAKAARYVHASYIGNLSPNKEYYFEIHYNGGMQYSNIFKTLPSSDMERDLIIVSGGDVSANERAQKMTNSLVKLKPDVIFIDGDAAYDDGMASCYYSFDLFLNMFENFNEKVGYMVPLVIGAGNHDIGANALNEAVIPREDHGPLFFRFFPQHSSLGDHSHLVPAVPELSQRKTYFYHLIGNTLHVSLDSGYDVPFEGYQAKWLDKVSYSYSRYSKFAHYHVPFYPVCKDDEDMTVEQIDGAAQAWVPIFENHNYQGVFENHLHMLKKTYPLRKGAIHPEGVIYFGDGNWGVHPHECKEVNKPDNVQLFEKMGEESHVWVMHVTKNGWEYYPLNMEGEKIMEPEYKPFAY